jgi:hypothetical protein
MTKKTQVLRPVVTTKVNTNNKNALNNFISAQKNMLKSTNKAVEHEKKLLTVKTAVKGVKVAPV